MQTIDALCMSCWLNIYIDGVGPTDTFMDESSIDTKQICKIVVSKVKLAECKSFK